MCRRPVAARLQGSLGAGHSSFTRETLVFVDRVERMQRRKSNSSCAGHRHHALPTCALFSLASVLAVCGVESVIELAAFMMGSVMGAGSFVLYSPIVLRLLRTRRASGMSVSTWALQLFAFTAACIYNAAKGHSLSAWGETLVFSVQVRLSHRVDRGHKRQRRSTDLTPPALPLTHSSRHSLQAS